MSDIIDQGTEAAQTFLDAALSQRKPEGPTPCGFCYNCNAQVASDQRWCDRDCRDDWEKRRGV